MRVNGVPMAFALLLVALGSTLVSSHDPCIHGSVGGGPIKGVPLGPIPAHHTSPAAGPGGCTSTTSPNSHGLGGHGLPGRASQIKDLPRFRPVGDLCDGSSSHKPIVTPYSINPFQPILHYLRAGVGGGSGSYGPGAYDGPYGPGAYDGPYGPNRPGWSSVGQGRPGVYRPVEGDGSSGPGAYGGPYGPNRPSWGSVGLGRPGVYRPGQVDRPYGLGANNGPYGSYVLGWGNAGLGRPGVSSASAASAVSPGSAASAASTASLGSAVSAASAGSAQFPSAPNAVSIVPFGVLSDYTTLSRSNPDVNESGIPTGQGLSFADQERIFNGQQAPAVPADAVSLALAYKNILAPRLAQLIARQSVPEEGLNYGPRTIPSDGRVQQSPTTSVPEERLYSVLRPIVELKPGPSFSSGGFDDDSNPEEFQRERLEQEAADAAAAQGNRGNTAPLTYGDLGYEPIGPSNNRFVNAGRFPSGLFPGSGGFGDSSSSGPSVNDFCDTVGQPLPDYRSSQVIINDDGFAGDTVSLDGRPGGFAGGAGGYSGRPGGFAGGAGSIAGGVGGLGGGAGGYGGGAGGLGGGAGGYGGGAGGYGGGAGGLGGGAAAYGGGAGGLGGGAGDYGSGAGGLGGGVSYRRPHSWRRGKNGYGSQRGRYANKFNGALRRLLARVQSKNQGSHNSDC